MEQLGRYTQEIPQIRGYPDIALVNQSGCGDIIRTNTTEALSTANEPSN
jgi:hypothetical protein